MSNDVRLNSRHKLNTMYNLIVTSNLIKKSYLIIKHNSINSIIITNKHSNNTYYNWEIKIYVNTCQKLIITLSYNCNKNIIIELLHKTNISIIFKSTIDKRIITQLYYTSPINSKIQLKQLIYDTFYFNTEDEIESKFK